MNVSAAVRASRGAAQRIVAQGTGPGCKQSRKVAKPQRGERAVSRTSALDPPSLGINFLFAVELPYENARISNYAFAVA